jgi:hypothetical protein
VGGREGSARREEGKERGGNQTMHKPVRGPTNHILSNLWRNIVWPTRSRTNWGKVVWWIVSQTFWLGNMLHIYLEMAPSQGPKAPALRAACGASEVSHAIPTAIPCDPRVSVLSHGLMTMRIWGITIEPTETTRYFFRYNGIPCLSSLIFWCFEYHPPMNFQTQFIFFKDLHVVSWRSVTPLKTLRWSSTWTTVSSFILGVQCSIFSGVLHQKTDHLQMTDVPSQY